MKNQHSFTKLLCNLAVTAGVIYTVNTLIDKRATQQHLLTSDSSNIFTWRGVKVYYERKGTGSPIILLHDLNPASSSYEWSHLSDLLAQHHTVYAIDLPGMGRSDKFDQPYSSFYYVEFLKEFIETMHLKSAAVVASNLSAPVAMMASVYDDSLIKKLILINPKSKSLSSASESDSLLKLKKAVMELPLIGTLIYNIMCSRTQIDFAFTEQYLYNPFHESADLVDTCYESAHLGHGQGRYFAAALISGYLNVDTNHVLSRLSVPTLLLEGKNSDDAEWITHAWSERCKQITTIEIEHTKALPHLEEPEIVAEKIQEFLA